MEVNWNYECINLTDVLLGIYAIKDPHSRSNSNSHPIRITASKPGWFYHRAVHVKLPRGQEGILTARANKPLFGRYLVFSFKRLNFLLLYMKFE